MSLTAVRPYLRARLNILGYSEWADPFNPEGIPANIIDRSYHQSIDSVQGIAKSNVAQEMEATATVRLAFKGFREPETALDEAISKAETAIADIINPTNFNAFSPPITGVFLDSATFEPLSDELNDNVVLAVCVFTVRIYVCVE